MLESLGFGGIARLASATGARKSLALPNEKRSRTLGPLEAKESGRSMGRISSLLAAVVCIAITSGCGTLGWFRAAGHIPGVAPTDYAFYNFCDVASQLYPAAPSQIVSSALQALGDLGFRVEQPPAGSESGTTTILTKTPDGRPTKITIAPQNSLTNVKVAIGPLHLGDEELSRDLLRRISLNFGTVMRAYTPIDTTLPKRLNASRFTPAPEGGNAPMQLEGEGLRPNEKRDKAAAEESAPPDQESAPAAGLPAVLQGLMPGPGGGGQANPNFRYVPFPIPDTVPDAP